jgi:hypothetical protein
MTGSGNCDCGDSCWWRESGFCPRHQGSGAQVAQLNADLQKLLITVLTAALSNFSFLASFDYPQFTALLQWLDVFKHMGDSFRRCVSLAFRSVFAKPDFVLNFASMPVNAMQALLQFFGGLINDPEFSKSFGVAFVKSYAKFTWMVLKTFQDTTSNDLVVLTTFIPFAFHCFNRPSVQALIEAKFDWVRTFEQTLALIVGIRRRTSATRRALTSCLGICGL